MGRSDASGETIQRTGGLSVSYAVALPSISGWFAGDGHIHTAFSDADLFSVDERAQGGAQVGLKWVIMTDHPQIMDSVEPNGNQNGDYGEDEWAKENSEVAVAQATRGIAVMNGEEISTAINSSTGHDSHYLGYDFKDFFNNFYNQNNNPVDLLREWRSGQQIILDVGGTGGFGIIAHPYRPILGTIGTQPDLRG